MEKISAFERIINEIMNEYSGSRLLEECMSFDVKAVKKVPLRYRIIALGFVKRLSLEELNEKLREEGCAQLYSRNMWEASLIFAFLKKMSYSEWKQLQRECDKLRSAQELERQYFKGSAVSMADIKEYLGNNSSDEQQAMETRHLTRIIEKKIEEAAKSRENFGDFLSANLHSFSVVREKTRYYFCKYLYYMLDGKIERYLKALRQGVETESAMAQLTVFKGLTQLKRQKMDVEQSRSFLEHAGISCGEIFDSFNYFYFEYVSLDWMEVLLEYYGNIRKLPDAQRKKLAHSLRRYNQEYKALSDDAVLLMKAQELDNREKEMDDVYSLDGKNRGYQRNRSGENTVRKFIKGTLDIDRTTLVCFLLFFGSESELAPEQAITRERLTKILQECGFASLNVKDDFDYFVIHYLEADSPSEYLMEEVTSFALCEENFYLYRMYQSSRSYDQEFRRLIDEV